MYIADSEASYLNTFVGSATQQATSVVTETNQNCYEGGTGCFSVYGFEYKPGFDNAVRPQIASWKTSAVSYIVLSIYLGYPIASWRGPC